MSETTYVIVGASLAGAKAAEELRNQGFDGRVVLIGAEAELPYERPPLSKDYLRGESEREKTRVQPEAFYREHQIELRTETTVTAIDPGAGRVTLEGSGELQFDRLLLTTGSEPRRLQIPGAELEDVHYLRTLADCEGLRERIETGGRLAVIGAGWIGSEVAASARQKGCAVTLIDPLQLPNERIFGREIGEFYRDVHAQHGIELLLGEGVESFEGDTSIQGVRTASGARVQCDFAVVGVGVVPRVALAQAAGLSLENGIVVDGGLRSSADNVFAAGDVANAWHPFYERRIRVEHWANALNQGPAAARAMLGQDVSYDRIPYFFSDQYEVGMEYSGYATEWDEVIFRGDRDAGEFIAFWLQGGRVVAGMNVNVWDVNEHVQALIRSRQPVDRSALADPDTPLESLVGPQDRR
ncbi:MAG TPA: FAD-dependent oxidoreductase [Solirubrobacteraceae bacterium]|nr:FAD-dependent oxidoreductase [Solirubrobacteraceae bacterium]